MTTTTDWLENDGDSNNDASALARFTCNLKPKTDECTQCISDGGCRADEHGCVSTLSDAYAETAVRLSNFGSPS